MTNHIFRAFSEKSFSLLWLGEIFTQVSVNLLNFFLILLVFSLTKSNTAVSGIVVSFTIPAILFGVIAGVYVDRWSKKHVLVYSNIIRAVLLVILGIFDTNLAMIYVVSFLITIASQFFIPAETPLIPLIVKEKHLMSANALFGLALYGSILIGYVIAGPLLLLLGHKNMFFFLSALLAIGAAFISFIKVADDIEDKRKKITRKTVLHEVREAFHLLRVSREVNSSLFVLALSQILILVIAVITPGYASEVLGMDLDEFPMMFVAPAALGVLVGAVLLTTLLHNYSRSKLINIGLLLSGIVMCALPFGSRISARQIVQTFNEFLPQYLAITPLHILVFLAFLIGLANAFVFVPGNTILQERTSDSVRGKIYGVLNTAVGVFSILPIIIVGSLSDIIGVGRVIVGIGIALLLIGVGRVVSKI